MVRNFATDFHKSRKDDEESVLEMVREFPKESDRPPLHDAVYKGQIGIVQTPLLTPGTDVNGLGFLSHGTEDTFMMDVTPLFLAIQLTPDVKIRQSPITFIRTCNQTTRSASFYTQELRPSAHYKETNLVALACSWSGLSPAMLWPNNASLGSIERCRSGNGYSSRP